MARIDWVSMVRLIVWYVQIVQWYGRRSREIVGELRAHRHYLAEVQEVRAALRQVERASPVVDYGRDVIVLEQRRPQLLRKHSQLR